MRAESFVLKCVNTSPGALQALSAAKHPMTIVVVNNGGCGIFGFLPIAKQHDVFDTFFANPHTTDLSAAAAAFGIKFVRAASAADFTAALQTCSAVSEHVMIEAVTDRSNMVPVHRELGAAVRRVADEALEQSVDLCYRWRGVGAPGRPVLVLLHGFLGCCTDWDPFTDALAEYAGVGDDNGYNCLAIDLPGHGGSGGGRGQVPLALAVSFEAMAAAVLKLLDRLAVRSCAIVGYSLGGRLALFLADLEPARFWAVCSLGVRISLYLHAHRLAQAVHALCACARRARSESVPRIHARARARSHARRLGQPPSLCVPRSSSVTIRELSPKA